MTTEAYPGAPTYTVAGVGPYNLGHEYSDEAEIVCVILDETEGTRLELDPEDFTVSPEGPATDGDVTLTVDAAAEHDGLKLTLLRQTVLEQGWAGQSAREKGLEDQLDRLARGLQDRGRELGAALRADRELAAFVPRAGFVLSFDEAGNPITVQNVPEAGASSAYSQTLLALESATAWLNGLGQNLAALAGLTGAANKLPYFTGPNAMALNDFGAFGQTLAASADMTAAQEALDIDLLEAELDALGDSTYWVPRAGQPTSATLHTLNPADTGSRYGNVGKFWFWTGGVMITSGPSTSTLLIEVPPWGSGHYGPGVAACYYDDDSTGVNHAVPARLTTAVGLTPFTRALQIYLPTVPAADDRIYFNLFLPVP